MPATDIPAEAILMCLLNLFLQVGVTSRFLPEDLLAFVQHLTQQPPEVRSRLMRLQTARFADPAFTLERFLHEFFTMADGCLLEYPEEQRYRIVCSPGEI